MVEAATPKSIRALHAGVVLGVLLSFLARLFQVFDPAFWTSGLGDWMDPYFINYLLEHWYRSVTTFRDPASPPMYFPVSGTLGYSHALVLYAPFYVPIRFCFHPFQAYSLTLFAVIGTGLICLYLVFRKRFGLPFLESLLLMTCFMTSTNALDASVAVWSQRASAFLIPPILLLGSRARPVSPKREGFLRVKADGLTTGVTAFLAMLLFTHDFHTALFALLFVVLALVSCGGTSTWRWPIVFWRAQPPLEKAAIVIGALAILWTIFVAVSGGAELRILGLHIRSHDWRRPALVGVAAVVWFAALRGPRRIGSTLARLDPWIQALVFGFAAGALVFVWVYLPFILSHRTFPEADLLNALRSQAPSEWNGPLDALRQLNVYRSLRTFVLAFVVGGVLCLPWVAVDRQTRRAGLWLIGISVLVLLMPIRLHGFSIWMAVFRPLPGFSAIRDPARIIYVYELAAILALAWILTRLPRTLVNRVAVCVGLVIVMAMDSNRDVFERYRPNDVYRRWVEAPITIDPACRSFFVKGATPEYMSRSSHMWTLYAIDAMFVSLDHSLPTLNGYSAWAPDEWNLQSPHEADYTDRVRRWIERNGLTGVCEFDLVGRTMRPF